MMTAGKSGIKMLEGGLVGGELVCVTSHSPGNIIPAVGTLEDPKEGKPAHIQACNSCINLTPWEHTHFEMNMFISTH